MRRRRVLAGCATAVGLAGCLGGNDEEAVPTATRVAPPTSTPTDTGTETERPPRSGETTHIGGSLNGRPFRIGDDLGMVEASETQWLHAFLDVRGKYERGRSPWEDRDVLALRAAKRDLGVKLVVSLQWDFIGLFGSKGAEHVPPAGSARDRGLIDYGRQLLSAIDPSVDVVVLGNEPIWETPDADLLEGDSPVVPFTRRLKDHLVEHYEADDTTYLVGAFNRLYGQHIREKYAGIYGQLFEFARTEEDVAGIDLHVHYADFAEAERMLEVARDRFPHGTITVTEFSPMWRYDRHKNGSIASFEEGDRFAERYGVPGDATVAEFLEAAKHEPITSEEMADFMETMPWYNVDFVGDMHDLLSAHDVSVGTFGYLAGLGLRNEDWTDDWAPFPINCLFQPVLIDTEYGAHPYYMDDFRDLA